MTLPSDSEIHDLVHRVVQRTLAGERSVPLPKPVGPSVESRSNQQTDPSPSGNPGPIVAIGADHGGFTLKQSLAAYLSEQGYQIFDCGTHSTQSVDYPDFAYAVARMVSQKQAWRGIVIDGAGIGSCMVANKVPGVRAAMCYDQATAINSREHNNANVLTLGAKMIGEGLARQIANIWLTTLFGGDRHARRLDKIMTIEAIYLKNKD